MLSTKLTFILIGSLAIAWLSATPTRAATPDQLMEVREHINKGNLLLGRRQFQQALDEYEKCLMIDPGNQPAKDNIVLAHNNWAIMFFSQRRYDQAKGEWEEALKLNPYDRNVKRNLQILKVTIDHLGESATKKTAAKEAPDAAANEGESTPSGAVLINSATNKPTQDQATPSGAVLMNSGSRATPDQPTPSGAVLINSGSRQTPDQPTPSGAVLLNNGGQRASTDGGAGASEGTYEDIPTYNGGTIKILSGRQHSTLAQPPASVSPPTVSPSPSAYASPGASAAPTISPATAVYTRADIAPAGDTIEQKLNAIELKVYGHTQGDTPVFKRLEKLEMDTGGSVKPGSVQERVETLRRAYGI